VRQLSAEAAVYRGGASVIVRDFTRMRGRPCIAGDRRSDLDEAPRKPPNIRWDHEMADGHPGSCCADEKGESRAGLGRAVLQSQTGDHILGVPALLEALEPLGLNRFLCCCKQRRVHRRKIPDFSYSWFAGRRCGNTCASNSISVSGARSEPGP